MYILVRVYEDGQVVAGEHTYTEDCLEQLALLVSEIHPMSYELCIGLEIIND